MCVWVELRVESHLADPAVSPEPDPLTSQEGIQDWLPALFQPPSLAREWGRARDGQRQVGLDGALHCVLTRAQLDRLREWGILGRKQATPIPYLGFPCLKEVTDSQGWIQG